MSNTNPTANYDKNSKPLTTVAESKQAFKLKSENLAPVIGIFNSKSPFSDNIMPSNGVTMSSSAKLQSASKLPGRAVEGTCTANFC